MAADLRTIPPPREGRVLSWLLERNQPAVRYRALVELMDRPENDGEVRNARTQIGRRGWAADLLRSQGPEGYWEARAPRTVRQWIDFLQFPPFRCTFFRALVLSDLGVDPTDPRVHRIADRLFEYKLRLGSPFNLFYEEACIVGNLARMMTRFGFGGDRRVRKLFDWLLEDQREDGGWNCSQGTPGTLDVWEPLAALAAVPRSQRSARMTRAIDRGAEFYLARGLSNEGARYAPWFRFHYPNHYFYDVLVGLDLVTQLGFVSDRRLAPALALLRSKRHRDGTWWMDRIHPDVGRGTTIHPDPSKIRPLVIEPQGRPSKWITLRALTVLKRTRHAA